MKIILIAALGIAALSSAGMLLPAPHMALLPLTIAAPESSPWLAAFNLLAGLAALRFYRRAAPAFLVAMCITAWPLTTLPGIETRMAAQQLPGPGLLNLFQKMRIPAIRPQALPLHMLLYRPPGRGPFPGVIDLYGGAWQRGAPADDARFDRFLASRGYAVFAIDYRHAPAARFPAQLEDVRAAIAQVYSNASLYQVDAKRLAICGRSSGGELALLAAYEKSAVPLRAVINFYGPTDLARGYAEPPSPDPIHVRAVLEAYLGGPPSQIPERYREASPVSYVRASLPPTLLIQGSRDHIVNPEFARALYGKLRASGNRVALLELPWAEHAFDAAYWGIGNRVALHYVEQFLGEVLQ